MVRPIPVRHDAQLHFFLVHKHFLNVVIAGKIKYELVCMNCALLDVNV